MKLVSIWNAQEAWARLGTLQKQPKLAYRLMKYRRKLIAELKDCEEARVKFVRETAGVEDGVEVASLQQGTREFTEFLAKFNDFLDNDSGLEPADITMDELVAALDAEAGNVLSEMDLERLGPFFKEAA